MVSRPRLNNGDVQLRGALLPSNQAMGDGETSGSMLALAGSCGSRDSERPAGRFTRCEREIIYHEKMDEDIALGSVPLGSLFEFT